MSKKVIDYATEITEVEDWTKLLDSDKVIVAEIYSSWFGFCEVYVPVIDKLMHKVTDHDTIAWRRLNMEQLEKELNAAHQKKQKQNKENSESQKTEAMQTVPLLKKWSGYMSPIPLFVFIKNKKILNILNECDGGKMNLFVNNALNGIEMEIEEYKQPVVDEKQSEAEETDAKEETEVKEETQEEKTETESSPEETTESDKTEVESPTEETHTGDVADANAEQSTETDSKPEDVEQPTEADAKPEDADTKPEAETVAAE